MMQKYFLLVICSLLLVIFSRPLPSQAQQPEGTALLDSLLAAENYAAADSALQSKLEILEAAGNIDSLAYYPYFVGRVAQQQQDAGRAIQTVELFVSDIERQTNSAAVLRKAHMELAMFYAQVGKLRKADKAYEKALAFTSRMEERTPEYIGIIENDRGVIARRMGDVATAMQHHRKALKHFKSYELTAAENFYISYNNMGAMMWFSSKTDSALYYYDKALEMLAAMEKTPKNRLYRPANVLNNKAALYYISGRTTDAIETMGETLRKYKQFIDHPKASDADRTSARQSMFRSIENLAGVYKELGSYSKTRGLLLNAFEQKKKHLDSDSPEIFKAQISLGQIELALKNYEKALEYLDAAISHIEQLPEKHLFWHAGSLNSKALLYDERSMPELAAPLFQQAEALYEEAYGDVYDATYLEFLANAALFFAENGNEKKAISKAEKAFTYVVKNDGEETLLAFKHRLNIASVHYALGNYRKSLSQSRQSLAILAQGDFYRDHLRDSVQVQFKKPQALLLQAKAEYQLQSERDTTFLIQQLHRLDEALSIIDRRRLVLSSEEDVNVQIANNKELFNFAKEIALELYQKTGDKKYLDRTIGYHESGIYNRIRARINAQKAVRFGKIPDSVILRETFLKENIQNRLSDNNIAGYLDATRAWAAFMDSLQAGYPSYFSLRYGAIDKQTAPVIPENSTVVRYLFADDQLYALVLTDEQKKLVELNYEPVRNHILQLHEQPFNASATGRLLHELYTRLWQPFENNVESERVIIIPDGELFNLSFETLATAPVTSFAQLADKSLLARHAISYQYSLNLLNENPVQNFGSDLVAFVPGFDDNLKQQYSVGASDSLFLDQAYMTLLPQPFMVDLADKLKDYFGGSIYKGAASTERQFTTSAGGHSIIHIGTHAESNNISPEYSRLFFAKNAADSLRDDNSLYAWEIYNHNLSSNLTLLTACSTGKPQHQPGEGMISLAHAFNYAGSQSLLTGLWNIDEKASAQIVDLFYQNLADGLPKDVALQQAKLSYLSAAAGRTAAPAYWAGLILLGDAGNIELKKPSTFGFLLPGLILILVTAVGFWLMHGKQS